MQDDFRATYQRPCRHAGAQYIIKTPHQEEVQVPQACVARKTRCEMEKDTCASPKTDPIPNPFWPMSAICIHFDPLWPHFDLFVPNFGPSLALFGPILTN